jgi:hypothetical protein
MILDRHSSIEVLPPILERLSINRQQWLRQSQQFEKLYASQFAKKRRTLKKTAKIRGTLPFSNSVPEKSIDGISKSSLSIY